MPNRYLCIIKYCKSHSGNASNMPRCRYIYEHRAGQWLQLLSDCILIFGMHTRMPTPKVISLLPIMYPFCTSWTYIIIVFLYVKFLRLVAKCLRKGRFFHSLITIFKCPRLVYWVWILNRIIKYRKPF